MTKVIDPLADEQLEEWAQALESENYEQIAGTLTANDGFCCLGVLADLNDDLTECGSFRAGSDCWLKTGLDAHYLSHNTQQKLVDLNDGGSTFPEIAAYIRSELMGKGGVK